MGRQDRATQVAIDTSTFRIRTRKAHILFDVFPACRFQYRVETKTCDNLTFSMATLPSRRLHSVVQGTKVECRWQSVQCICALTMARCRRLPEGHCRRPNRTWHKTAPFNGSSSCLRSSSSCGDYSCTMKTVVDFASLLTLRAINTFGSHIRSGKP